LKRHAKLSTSCCALAIAALLTRSAAASDWECGERSNLPIEGKNYCAAGDFRQSQTNLAKVFAVLLKKQQSKYGDSNALSESRLAFQSYRDNQCLAENKRIADKPFHPMIVAQCQTRLTNLRIVELNRMLKRYQ